MNGKNMIREIESSDWPTFCERVSKERAGATVKLEVIESGGANIERVATATLQSIAFSQTDSCSDLLTLRLRSDREIVYEIIEPIRILLHPSGTGDFNQVQIEAESGMSFITIHPPIHAQMLEGMKAK